MEERELYSLPKGWIWTTIGEIGLVVSGGTPSTDEAQFWGKEIPWITPADLSNYKNKYISIGKRSISPYGLDYSSALLMPKGTLLFSSRAPIGYVVIAQNDLTTNQGFKNLIPTKYTYVDYLYYYLQHAKNEAVKRARGTTFPELSAKGFSEIPVPFPPMDIQQQIVAKIENLFDDLSEAEASLRKAERQLKIYEHVILKSAFDGNITKEWRKNNKIVSAYKYLQEVAKKRKKDNDLLSSKRGKKRYSLPHDFEFSKNLDIPSWAIAKLDKLVTIAGRLGWKGLRKEEYTSEGPLFLSVHSLNFGKAVNYKDALHISDARYKESPDIMLRVNDILLCKDGAGIGKIGIVTQMPYRTTINSSLLIIRGNEIFYPDFLYYLLKGPRMQAIVNERISGSAIPHLFQKDVKEFALQVPPLLEQKQIVQEIEQRLEIIDELRRAINNNIKRTVLFRKKILINAFEGRLINTAVNDEDAIRLLSMIAIEKKSLIIEQKYNTKTRMKNRKSIQEKRSILKILETANSPMSAKDVWLQSIHKDDIEGFYSELRDIQDRIIEVKKDTESLLSLRHEN